MSELVISSVSASAGIVTLTVPTGHGLVVGEYVSIRNVNSTVNGQYFVLGTPTVTNFTIDIANAGYNLPQTTIDGIAITTSINSTGKPAYVYDKSADTWYQISGKVNTNGNYTWTGTHLHQAPVTMEDLLILSNISASVSSSPVGGGYLYVENGALKFKGGNGTITTIAPA